MAHVLAINWLAIGADHENEILSVGPRVQEIGIAGRRDREKFGFVLSAAMVNRQYS